MHVPSPLSLDDLCFSKFYVPLAHPPPPKKKSLLLVMLLLLALLSDGRCVDISTEPVRGAAQHMATKPKKRQKKRKRRRGKEGGGGSRYLVVLKFFFVPPSIPARTPFLVCRLPSAFHLCSSPPPRLPPPPPPPPPLSMLWWTRCRLVDKSPAQTHNLMKSSGPLTGTNDDLCRQSYEKKTTFFPLLLLIIPY